MHAFILILFLAGGDVRIIQGLNEETCRVAKEVIQTASPILYPPAEQVKAAYCINTRNPQG